MKNNKLLLVSLLVALAAGSAVLLVLTNAGQAQEFDSTVATQLKELNESTGLPGSAQKEEVLDAAIELVQLLLGTIAIIFFILILWAGFRWMTAAGNPERIDKAKKIMGSSIIGLLIIVSAYMITSFVFYLILELGRD